MLYDTMKATIRAYTSKRECSVQEAVYHIFLELYVHNFLRVFPAVYFVNTNMPEYRSRILLSEEEIGRLPDHSRDVFKKNILTGTKINPILHFAEENTLH